MRGSGSEMSSPGVKGEDSQRRERGCMYRWAQGWWGHLQSARDKLLMNMAFNGHLEDHCLAGYFHTLLAFLNLKV